MSLTKTHNRMIEGAEINVLDYGAYNDGTNASATTLAIQAALDKTVSSGKHIYFPPGTYLIDSELTISPSSMTKISGDRAWIRTNATLSHMLKIDNRDSYNISIHGMQFIANSSSTVTDLVIVEGAPHLNIEHCRFIADSSNCNLLRLSDNIYLGRIDNCHFDGHDSTAYGIYTIVDSTPGSFQPNGFMVTNTWIKSCDTCIHLTKPGTGWMTIGNWFEDSNLSFYANGWDGYLSINDVHETLKGYDLNGDDSMIISPVVGTNTMTLLAEINGENIQIINPGLSAAQPTSIFNAGSSANNFYVETDGVTSYTTNNNSGTVVVSNTKRRLYGAISEETKTFASLDASPSVRSGNIFETTGTLTITTFDNGVNGQKVTVKANDTITVLGVSMNAGDVAEFIRIDGTWYPINT